MKVTEIMSRPVVTVGPETSVKEAAGILVARGISALPVVTSGGELAGIVSEADLIPLETRPDPRSQAMPLAPSAGTAPRTVAEVMTKKVTTVRADCEVSRAARLMLKAGIKRVPVMSGRRVVGIVSRRDLVRVIARQDDVLRSELADRLSEVGITMTKPVAVTGGVAAIELVDGGPQRRLAESVAMSVPGVLEVRFTTPAPASRP